MIAIGATSAGAHLVHRLSPTLAGVISLGGGALALAGLLLGFGTMAMMLFEDVYLHIREAGLLVHRDGQDTEIAWDDLEGVEAVQGRLVLRVARSGALDFHAGREAEVAKARIEEARRRAALGLPAARVSSGADP